MTALLEADAATRLEWAKEQIGAIHVRAVADLLVTAGWCWDDAFADALTVLAASYLVAAEDEGEPT